MVQYVKGSHKWQMIHAITSFSGEEADDGRYKDAAPAPQLPPIDEASYELVSWDMEPGDVVVHHGFSVHGATGNADLARRRRGYAVRWIGDDITFDPRPGTMHFNWADHGLDCGLEEGDPMVCDLHPRCYSALD